MKPEGWVDGYYDPPPYESVATLIARAQEAGRDMAAMYLGNVKWNGGRETEVGWAVWHGGVFVNPFDAGYFFAGDFNTGESLGRLLQPRERLHVRYVGERINGNTQPENVPVDFLVGELQKAGKEMGAILIEKLVWKDGTELDWRTKVCPHGDWAVWHGGVFVNPFRAEYFLADALDCEKTVGRLLRPNEPLEVKHGW